MILAYETATNICSVAFHDSEGEVFEKRIQGRSVHSDNLFLFTQELMDEHNFAIANLDAVLVSNGPGSYTGLRIAASAIKGILFGSDTSLYAVNTLASFAMGCKDEATKSIHSIIDARRTHVYHQAYKFEDGLRDLSESKVMELSEFENLLEADDCVIGTGIDRIKKEALNNIHTFDDTFIAATTLIDLFKTNNADKYCIKTDPEDLNSNYISSSQVNNSSI